MNYRKMRMIGMAKRAIGFPFWLAFNYMPKWMFRMVYGEFLFYKYPYDGSSITNHYRSKKTSRIGRFIFEKSSMYENPEWAMFHTRRKVGCKLCVNNAVPEDSRGCQEIVFRLVEVI